MRRTRLCRHAAFAFTALLTLAACGDDDHGAEPTATASGGGCTTLPAPVEALVFEYDWDHRSRRLQVDLHGAPGGACDRLEATVDVAMEADSVAVHYLTEPWPEQGVPACAEAPACDGTRRTDVHLVVDRPNAGASDGRRLAVFFGPGTPDLVLPEAFPEPDRLAVDAGTRWRVPRVLSAASDGGGAWSLLVESGVPVACRTALATTVVTADGVYAVPYLVEERGTDACTPGDTAGVTVEVEIAATEVDGWLSRTATGDAFELVPPGT